MINFGASHFGLGNAIKNGLRQAAVEGADQANSNARPSPGSSLSCRRGELRGGLKKISCRVVFGGLPKRHFDTRKNHETSLDFYVSVVSCVVNLARRNAPNGLSFLSRPRDVAMEADR